MVSRPLWFLRFVVSCTGVWCPQRANMAVGSHPLSNGCLTMWPFCVLLANVARRQYRRNLSPERSWTI
ncbi:hypothetical protein FKM82_009857 [Ascaphus truei]